MSAEASSSILLIVLLMIGRISASNDNSWCSLTVAPVASHTGIASKQRCLGTTLNSSLETLINRSANVDNSNLNEWYPYNSFVDDDDNVYVADASENRVILFNNSLTNGTTVVNLTCGNEANRLHYPTALFIRNQTLFITGSDFYGVNKFSCNNSVEYLESDNISLSFGLYVDENNTVYASNYLNHSVVKWNDGETNGTVVAGGNGIGNQLNQLSFPWGIHVGKNGTIYIADSNNRRIQKWDRDDTNGTTLVGNTNDSWWWCELIFPTAITLDQDEKNIFILDTRNNTIVKCSENSSCNIFVNLDPSSNSSALGLFLDSKGKLTVTDTFGQQILSYPTKCEHSTLPPTTTNPSQPHDNRNDTCYMLDPCKNDGTCINVPTNKRGYNCSCKPDFFGDNCDDYPCKENPCLYNGKCNIISESKYNCTCGAGRRGRDCETKEEHCHNIICNHKGVCDSLPLNYTCRCYGGSYGAECEHTSEKVRLYEMVSKSVSYIAIIAMLIVVTFVVVLDVLKYCFGIDPALEELRRSRQQARAKKQKTPTAQRFIYVHESPQAFE